MARSRTEEIARGKHYYRWVYRTVLADWRKLEVLFREHNIVPIASPLAFGQSSIARH